MLTGCGIVPVAAPPVCTDQSGCASVAVPSTDEFSDAFTGNLANSTAVVMPVFQPPVSEGSFVAPNDFANVISVLLDSLLLELLTPSGPQLDGSFTYLERLCLQGDDPDFFCRQRFGN